MQRIIAQIGGKPIAVQIQQSPQQQQQNQQKILAKVLTSAGGGQLISVESLLAKQGLKLASTTGHATQINRQGKQVIQTQYQVIVFFINKLILNTKLFTASLNFPGFSYSSNSLPTLFSNWYN